MTHRWSGWPGAWCLDCGCDDPVELKLAEREDLASKIPMLCPEPNSRRNDPYKTKPMVCKHGSLARSCYICELEAERDRYRKVLEKIAEGLSYKRHSGMDSQDVSASRDQLRLWAKEALSQAGDAR